MSSAEPFIAKSGETITEEIADELACEAEAGYDIHPSQVRPGPGRKSLSGGSGKSPAIQLRLAPDAYERVRAAAAAAGESISDFVREAIDRQLKWLDRGTRR